MKSRFLDINPSPNKSELSIPLKFGLGTFVRLHVCSNHHVKNDTLQISHIKSR